MKRRAIIFMAWGETFVREVENCIGRSNWGADFDVILLTDEATSIGKMQEKLTGVVRCDFRMSGYLRKTEMMRYVPDGYDSFLFLDSDTVVVEDISLGFEMAERFQIAMSPAPHYSLESFWGFDRIMRAEGVRCAGQMQYNTGVIFFQKCPAVAAVFARWEELAVKHGADYKVDQPFFTLAMEQLEFNPYTLSISFNYRGFGDAISGLLRIWHSHGEMPQGINTFKRSWPPRRAWPSKLVFPYDHNRPWMKWFFSA